MFGGQGRGHSARSGGLGLNDSTIAVRNTSGRRDTEGATRTIFRTRQVTNEMQEGERLLRSLVGAHGRIVRVAVARNEHDQRDADEVWADVFHLAYRRIDELAGLSEDQQRSWLVKAARYLTANAGRRNATRRRAFERLIREPLPWVPTPEDELIETTQRREQQEESDAIRVTLAGLPTRDRQVLVLNALGHDGPSIADHLGISPGAARKRLMNARVAFRQAHPVAITDELPTRTDR